MQVKDHVGVYQNPVGSDCIKWSQDNLLAVAAGQSITIFSPGALGGPRAFAPFKSIDTSVVAPGFTPKEWLDSPQFAMSAFYEVNIKGTVTDTGYRAVSWSPVGCTSSGGCYLAALSADYKVRILAPPASAMSSSWVEWVDVTKVLQDYMVASDWQEIDCLVVDDDERGAATDAAMRLRGGGSKPSYPPTAASIPGMTGCGGCSVAAATDASVLRLRGGGPSKRSAAGRGVAANGSGGDGTSNSGDATIGLKVETVSPAAPVGVTPTFAGDQNVVTPRLGSFVTGPSQNPQKSDRISGGTLKGKPAPGTGGSDGGDASGDDNGERVKRPPAKRRRRNAHSGAPMKTKEAAIVVEQLEEGDRVEVHNKEEGLIGAWFPARLVKLSPAQYAYGLMVYDELQASEEVGAPMLTEWFPLPGCPRLLTPAAARASLPLGPDGVSYPAHCRRGYSVRPMPPSQVAPSPIPPPLHLGMQLEVLHDAAWWTVQLRAVTGPKDAVAEAALGRGNGSAVAGGSSGSSGVMLEVQLLHGLVAISVPLERSRAAVAWDPKTGVWTRVDERKLRVRPAPFQDVVLLEGGSSAVAVLLPLLLRRVEVLRHELKPDKNEDGAGAWSEAVEAAGQEMLHSFALEFQMLNVDGPWLWAACREHLAALQGGAHPGQMTVPSWAVAPTIARVPSCSLANPTASGPGTRGSGDQADKSVMAASEQPPRQQTPEGGISAALVLGAQSKEVEEQRGSRGAKAGGVCATEGEGAAATATIRKSPRKSTGGAGRRGRASASDAAPLDFSGTSPDTFDPYDNRPNRDEGGPGLEKAAPGMISKRFSALLSAADPTSVHAYALGERMLGTELQLYDKACGEFMHLYRSKLPEGADKRIAVATKYRCRQLVNRAPKSVATDNADREGNAVVAALDSVVDEGDGSQRTAVADKRRLSSLSAKQRAAAEASTLDKHPVVIKEEEHSGQAGPSSGVAPVVAAGGQHASASAAEGAAPLVATKFGCIGEQSSVRMSDTGLMAALAGTVVAPVATGDHRGQPTSPHPTLDSPQVVTRKSTGGAGRRGRASASDAAPLDFSGTNPDTFDPYDNRPNRDEGGPGLEKAAPGMVLGRWLELFAAADPVSLRYYKPGEHMTGAELRMYEQSCGEFMHLYGDKLPEGSARRILREAQRRVRLRLRLAPTAEEAGTPIPRSGPNGAPDAGTAGTGEDTGNGGLIPGVVSLFNASGRKARAAALRSSAATKQQMGGHDDGADFHDGADGGGDAGNDSGVSKDAKRSCGAGAAGSRKRSHSGRMRSQGEQEGGDGDELYLGAEVEESGGSSDSESLVEEEEEAGSGDSDDDEAFKDVVGEQEAGRRPG